LKLGRVGRLLRAGLVTERQTIRLKTLAALTILLLLILKRRGNRGKFVTYGLLAIGLIIRDAVRLLHGQASRVEVVIKVATVHAVTVLNLV
jgi:hypothetical protein